MFAYAKNPNQYTDPMGLANSGINVGIAQQARKRAQAIQEAGITGSDPNGIPQFDKINPYYHEYTVTSSCSKSNKCCTVQNVKDGLLKYPAPGASGNPIKDGQEGYALPVGYVVHRVDAASGTVTNVTLKDRHMLYPGIVRRSVVDAGDSVKLVTYGEGTGDYPLINELAASTLWGSVDGNIFDAINNCK